MSSGFFEFIELDQRHFNQFFDYLNDHLADNGVGLTPLFQPQSRYKPGLPTEKAATIQRELLIPVGEPKWRRGWIALHQNNKNVKKEIVGHIDLRSHGSRETQHRALLGMGTHRDFRRCGLGRQLLAVVVDWINDNKVVETIDLWVLNSNKPAISFYKKEGFEQFGQINDMFRIDGESEGQIFMSKKII